MLLNVFDKNGVCSGGSRISHEKKGDTDGFSDFLLKQQQTSRNRQGGSGGVGWDGAPPESAELLVYTKHF